MAEPLSIEERRGFPAPRPTLWQEIYGEFRRLFACLGFGLVAALVLMLSGVVQ
ncbi:hypothetical protein [Ancylobacter oerskovii]|uniref:Uncharacterized protein n=1 Tax=Ancylobacter oerskovii TaxID=459519 RepID=A0ABW4YRL2_9HYPH|nr:hypothetical protein [Ancylobacter oerskovii]MBS7545655.1 hypothetical protein [Ancylobacter oerskovii]